jgi:tRNA modification GTPase
MYPLDDTIAAIASPPGGAARGTVRISGPGAIECLMRFFQPAGVPLAVSGFSPRPLGEGQGVRAADGREIANCKLSASNPQSLIPNPSAARPHASPLPKGEGTKNRAPHVIARSLRFPDLASPLPCDAYVWPDTRSYTGQPVVEIHTLGSPPLLELVLRSLCAAGARLAGPGEFTLRAFLAGRIDLTQAEAVLGVIDAHGPRELQIALGQLAGGLAQPLHRLRDTLLDMLAHLEAGFDFADEDLEFITREELDSRLAAAENDIAAIRRQVASRGESSHGIRVVLVGRPNTGKSSLFNALAGDSAAIVSEQPGTTRDYLVAELDLDGVKCRLIDTAGTWGEGREEWGDEIAAAADSAAAAQRREAHLEVLCLDSTRPLDDRERRELAAADIEQIVVLTKCDVVRRTDLAQAALETSSFLGQGIAELRDQLRRRALAAKTGGEVVAGTAVRSADSLRLAGESLRRARHVAAACQEELAAAEIRTALTELGKVVGAIYTEDVLDRVFSRFCVGK